jgi:glycosyltransferase involved in cell wall biosynthesis
MGKRKMKNIFIVAPFTILKGEYGFNRFFYLAERLFLRGHSVTLITSNFNHVNKQFRNIIKQNSSFEVKYFKIILIKELGYKKNFCIKRILSHLYFSYNLFYFFKNIKIKPDIIYCAYPLMGSAFITEKYCEMHKIPFILDIQDIWPEAISSVLKIPESILDILILPLAILANYIYNKADYIFAVSDTYLKRAKIANRKCKRYLCVYIGTDLEYFDRCKSKAFLKPKNEFWFIYVGTLSYSYDLVTAIKAISNIKFINDKKIKLLILGDGPNRKELERLANSIGSTIEFLGYIPYEEMAGYLKASDVAINAIAKRAKQSITNKIGDYLAAGLPILNSSENIEFCRMIERYKIGFNYSPGDWSKLAYFMRILIENEHLKKIYGNNSRSLAERYFDREKTYKKIIDIIESI